MSTTFFRVGRALMRDGRTWVLGVSILLGGVAVAQDWPAGQLVEAKLMVNLRSKPDVTSRIAAVLQPGDRVVIVARLNEFWQVQTDDGEIGYVKARHLRELAVASAGTAERMDTDELAAALTQGSVFDEESAAKSPEAGDNPLKPPAPLQNDAPVEFQIPVAEAAKQDEPTTQRAGPKPIPLSRIRAIAGKVSPDVRAAEYRNRIAARDVALARDQYWPQLDASASYGYEHYTNFTEQTGTDTGRVNYAIGLSAPLVDLSLDAQIKLALAQEKAVFVQSYADRVMAVRELALSYEKARAAGAKVRIYQGLHAQAQELSKMAAKRAEQGVAGSRSALATQALLNEARVRLDEAQSQADSTTALLLIVTAGQLSSADAPIDLGAAGLTQYAEFSNQVMAHNPRLAQRDAKRKVAQEKINERRRRYYPALTAAGGYRKLDDIDGMTGFRDEEGAYVEVGMKYSLNFRANRDEVERARLEFELAGMERDALALELQQLSQEVWAEYSSALDRARTVKLQVAAYGGIVSGDESAAGVRKVDTLDRLQQIQNLAYAQIAALDIEHRLFTAQIDALALTGKLSPRPR